jgi:hypothetical protein
MASLEMVSGNHCNYETKQQMYIVTDKMCCCVVLTIVAAVAVIHLYCLLAVIKYIIRLDVNLRDNKRAMDIFW